MKKHRWLRVFIGSISVICIIGGFYFSTRIIQQLKVENIEIIPNKKNTAEENDNVNEVSDAGEKAEEKVEIDENEDEETSKKHQFTQSDWLKVSKAGASLIKTMETMGELPELESSAAELNDSEMEYLLSSYFYCLEERENPGIEIQNTSDVLSNNNNIYAENTIKSVIKSFTGKELNHVIQGNYIKFQDNTYLFPQGAGEPVYRLRLCNVQETNDELVLVVELLENAVIGSYTNGIYRMKLKEDNESLFLYHFISVEKMPSLEGKFVRAEASSVLEASAYGDYKPENVLDRVPATAWVEGVAGLGIGESITIYADEPQKIHGICLLEGYAKNEDIFTKNSCPYKFRIEFSDGSVVEAEPQSNVAQYWYSEQPIASMQDKVYAGRDGANIDSLKDNMDFISLGKEIETTFVKVTILDVQPGTKYEDTCISEIIPY